LSACDALIFLNASNIECRKILLRRSTGCSELETTVEHGLVAHESTHIACNLAGKQLRQWDPNTCFDSPEVLSLFNEFVSVLGEGKFRELSSEISRRSHALRRERADVIHGLPTGEGVGFMRR
jgi:hypothetical protein